ncbi:MAG: response regulator [Anaerolineales bacterium]|uniref:response regulator n=1 Tax=Candidatus Villigracilis vicinus TaxID=3140679 RepID=UPI00313556D5|nr:response regulator [Anaerolineales bacterium]
MFTQPRVLIVDDDLNTRVTIEAMLALENYELHFAENGVRALSMAPGIQPDLILLDVMMPGMNGFEVCKNFRSMPGLAEIPIVLVTALDDRESRMAGMKAGADDFVTKPFDNHELRMRIQNMIRLNRYKQRALYNSIELKFYETFVEEPNGFRDQNTTQVNAISNIRDYVEAEEALLVLFDSENTDLATKKILGKGPAWRSESSFLVKSSKLCNSLAQNITMLDYGLSLIGEMDPALDNNFTSPVRNVLLAPLIVNNNFLGAMFFINPLFDLKKDDRRSRFLQLMVKGMANATFALEHTRQLTISKAALEASQWEILNSRNTLRTFFDNIPNCIYVIDRSYTIQIINSRRSDRVGKTPQELVGMKCYEGLYGNSAPCALCRVADAFDGMPAVRNLREWGPKETFIHWEITTIPIRENSDVVNRAIVFDEDITEKWILEAGLIQSEKMATIGQLAANVAHEINNPLAAIIANAQLLQLDLADADEDIKEALKLIETAGVRAAKIVGDLLKSARKEKRDEFEYIPLNETITDALAIVNFEIRNREITINLDLSEGMPNITAHQNQLKGVWINLIMNALGAIEDAKGVISISTRYENNEYRVVISDNGKGIDPENQEHIFEPFFTTKDASKGTGLGLSVSLQVIKEHHGTIDFETRPGKGTRFIITLPDIQHNENY